MKKQKIPRIKYSRAEEWLSCACEIKLLFLDEIKRVGYNGNSRLYNCLRNEQELGWAWAYIQENSLRDERCMLVRSYVLEGIADKT
jgi:hypothetical protein